MTTRTVADDGLFEVRKGSAVGTRVYRLTMEGQIQGADGTLAKPTYSFASDKASGLHYVGSSNLALVIAGTKLVDYAAAAVAITGSFSVSTTVTADTSLVGGTMTVAGGSLTDSTGAISFGNENLTTTGSLTSGALAATAITGSGILSIDSTIQSTSTVTGSIHTDGGLGVAKDVFIGGNLDVAGTFTGVWNPTVINLGDDEQIQFGAAPDYWMEYNLSGTQFRFRTTDADGAGADGTIFSVQDGTDDVVFNGDITATNMAGTLTTAAQGNVTSLGTLTALQIDNLLLDGNTLSSTGGVDLLITPLGGQQIVLDGTIIIDAGVVTGATSITSTAFVGALTGNADTATLATTATALATPRNIGGVTFDGSAAIVPQTIQVVDSTDASSSIAMFDSATGSLQPKTDAGLTYNATTGLLTATGFAGPLTGAVTGNASTATVLQTPRDINGVAFDGSANITVTAAAGTLTGTTLKSTVVSSSLTSLGTIGSLVATSADINGGTIDGTVIGGAVGAAGSFTTLDAGGVFTVIDGSSGLRFQDVAGAARLLIDGSDGDFTGGDYWFLEQAGAAGDLIFRGQNVVLSLAHATSNATFSSTIIVTGLLTATAGIKLGTTVTLTEGTANRLELATGDSFKIVSGTMGIGASPLGNISLNIDGAFLTGATQHLLSASGLFSSAATTTGRVLQVRVGTPDVAFTMAEGIGVRIQDALRGAASTITTLIGLDIIDQTQGGTNYAIRTGTGLVQFGENVTVAGTLTVGGNLTFSAAGANLAIGTAALATTATDGFIYISTSAGTPTGVPTTFTGRTAIHFDTTNNILYVYDGGWVDNTSGGAGDITAVNITCGIGLLGDQNTASGDHTQTIDFDATSLTALASGLVTGDHIVVSDGTVSKKALISGINLSIFSNNLGWTSNTGDITRVDITAGTGLTGSVTTNSGNHTQTLSVTGLTNTEIAAGAEIAVSKLADGIARQLLQTDAAGTGVEWASNIDIPGSLAVTSVVTMDSTLGVSGSVVLSSTLKIDGNIGFYAGGPVAKPTGVAVSDAAIHAALVTLNLIAGP